LSWGTTSAGLVRMSEAGVNIVSGPTRPGCRAGRGGVFEPPPQDARAAPSRPVTATAESACRNLSRAGLYRVRGKRMTITALGSFGFAFASSRLATE
jgi:hypothetical protein